MYTRWAMAHVHIERSDVDCEPRDKTCPRCHKTFPMTRDHWYFRRTRRAGVCPQVDCDWSHPYTYWQPCGYCKKCAAKATVAYRSRTRRLKRLVRADPTMVGVDEITTCACCGIEHPRLPRLVPGLHPVPRPVRMCVVCLDAMNRLKWDVDTAKATWVKYRSHIAEDAEIERTWFKFHNRPRRVHQGCSLVPDDAPSHKWCISVELQIRLALQFLIKNRLTA